ncbi:BPTD_3080 family restriction endonuclease [uncultured Jannaschia sp.]|uniref:BPTD_3080 family restriction endonuclease n=1 Tax=uncultured Jannaschia sp. TaxID=293347 RepID=UPI002617B1A5|nr:DEAD/DEAH box helicase family protein [uncultured Jannaschia sp.]
MSFFERPILNSPYQIPTKHHALDADGQPMDVPPRSGRRPSDLRTPIPRSRTRRQPREQTNLEFETSTYPDDGQDYSPTSMVNEIRQEVATWRSLPPHQWQVTPVTQNLLLHWREHDFLGSGNGIRPFFCQVEAVETVIWLTEVARNHPRHKRFWKQLTAANKDANPALMRIALKLATGAGKTTVMAMLIAWHTLNHKRSPGSKTFTNGFLIVAPGITIRDRLQVLQPSDPNSYYRSREIVPRDMLDDLGHARIVITNYHSFQRRDLEETNKVGKAVLDGRGQPRDTRETEGQMVARVAKPLMGLRNIIAINDEAHHCYREKPDGKDEKLKGDALKEARANNEYARLWINGLGAVKRKLGLQAVFDLSATPFFLSGSGYDEGTLFPWTVSDFSLMDAIECGIVKLPRIPVADDVNQETGPIYRELWSHIGSDMEKKGATKGGGQGDPNDLPTLLKSALTSLYAHYREVDEQWRRAGIGVPPVFIVVCQNTAHSKLVADWIAGWAVPNEDGDDVLRADANLPLFTNFDEYGNRLAKPNTLLVDSVAIEEGRAIDEAFLKAMKPQIELFESERRQRDGAGTKPPSDSELMREVMNTIGRPGKLGERVRCVVSVSMLTEGWDTNTVTHILGVRAFGTQLLCEQVVGRALRRYSYDLNDEGLFDVEHADILGIPFNFTQGAKTAPAKAPRETTRVQAVPGREQFEIVFPRVRGYRVDLPPERVPKPVFTEDSRLVVSQADVGPRSTLLEGIVGEGVTIELADPKDRRPATITMDLARQLMAKHWRDEDGEPKLHLFGQLRAACRQWIEGGYFDDSAGGAERWLLCYQDIADQAVERIQNAIVRGHTAETGESRVLAVLDPFNPKGSTRYVGFNTTKDVYDIRTKSHLNAAVLDSGWEGEFARVCEAHPRVLAFVKNQGLDFRVPWRDGTRTRHYEPDFIVQLHVGSDEPLNLIVEIKGIRGEEVRLKSDTMRDRWVPGVNNLGIWGHWAFAEFGEIRTAAHEFQRLIDAALAEHTKEDA